MIQKKRLFLFVLVLLVFSSILVVAEVDEETKQRVEDYVTLKPDDASTVDTLNAMAAEERTPFFTEIADQTEIPALSKLTDQFKEFDSNGNVVLENGQKINLKSLYNYAKEANAGKGEFSYDFRGESFDSSSPRIKEFEVTDDGVSVSFENGASLSLDKDANFDFESRSITVGEESIAWSNMNGEVAVKGDEISLGVLSDASGETDLKDFPIVQDNNGNAVSPYQEAVSGVELPDGFEKPSKGKFKEFEKEGKRYSVDSDGKVYEVKSSSLKLGKGSSVSEVSNGMVALQTTKSESGEQQTFGEFFTKESTAIVHGGEKPTNMDSNFLWAHETDGKLSVMVNSVGEGRLFYNQQAELEELELHGNVLVKNGDYFLESDSEGGINIREIKGEQSTFAFGIGKLGSGGEDTLLIKEYDGDDEALKGKLVLYRSDGQLAIGGSSVATPVDLRTGGKKFESEGLQWMRGQLSKYPGYTQGTLIHEATHHVNGLLTAELGLGGYLDGPSNENSAAFYLWGEDTFVVMPTAGFRKDSVSDLIPMDTITQSNYQNYFHDNGFGSRDALHTFEDYVAELNGFESESPALLRDMAIFSAAVGMKMQQSNVPPARMQQYTSGYKFITERASTKSIDFSAFQQSTNPKAVAIRDYLKQTYGTAWTQKHFGF